ncbi:MAG: hypothetical protein QM535_21150 [Limnohabitans sp.]|nr:hypothetical protein [Limnohabitans sp.]
MGSAVHKTAEYFCQFKLGEINEEQYRLRVNALEDTLDKDKKEDIKYKKALEAFKK